MEVSRTALRLWHSRHCCWFFACIFTLQGCVTVSDQESDGLITEIFSAGGALHAVDGRERFRQVFCAINATRGPELPDYRHCDDALRAVPPEPSPRALTAMTDVDIEPFTILFVPGLGYDCFNHLVDIDQEFLAFSEKMGHEMHVVPVKGLADTAENARIIRDSIRQLRAETARLIIIGYSKGANDALEALVTYKDLADSVDAMVGLSSAVGGSYLSVEEDLSTLNLYTWIPGGECESAAETILQNLNPEIRRQWLTDNTLPQNVAYFSILGFPEPERISYVLRSGARKVAKYDPRNDGVVTVIDQVIPGSQVLAFVNADHWATALPIARTHAIVGATFINRNDFPREVLLEAILRFVDAELAGN